MFNRTIKCEDCKHIISRGDAQKVKALISYTYYRKDEHGYSGKVTEGKVKHIWYCPEHKKDYDLFIGTQRAGKEIIPEVSLHTVTLYEFSYEIGKEIKKKKQT